MALLGRSTYSKRFIKRNTVTHAKKSEQKKKSYKFSQDENTQKLGRIQPEGNTLKMLLVNSDSFPSTLIAVYILF